MAPGQCNQNNFSWYSKRINTKATEDEVILRFDQTPPTEFYEPDKTQITAYEVDKRALPMPRSGGFFVLKGILDTITMLGQILIDLIT